MASGAPLRGREQWTGSAAEMRGGTLHLVIRVRPAAEAAWTSRRGRMDLVTVTVAERPDLAHLLDDFNSWPRFMHQDPVGSLYYADPVGMYPEFVQVAIDQDRPGQLVAKAYSVPFTWDGDPAVSLPGDGWDGVILSAGLARLAGRRGNLISALEISIREDLRGSGLSQVMLGAMRENAAT